MDMFPLPRPDSMLVRQALAGDPRAFEALVARYQRRAYAVAHAHGVGPRAAEDSEDIVQQAFLRAFRALPALREHARFGPWLLRIVQNAARNHLERRQPALPIAVAEDGDGGGLEPEAAPAGEPLEGRELREHLWRKVAELPAGTREAIFLYYQDGRSVRAVARTLEISTTAVKQRLKRGRDLLRESLWRELGETLRDMLPSARQWRQRSRALSLLVLAALPAAWAQPAAAAAAPASLSSVPLTSRILVGAFSMSSKKLALSLSLAVLLGAGGFLGLTRALRREPANLELAGRSGGASAPAGAGARAGQSDDAPQDPARLQVGAASLLPAAIEGRVSDGTSGVAGARVVALALAAWQGIAGSEEGELDLGKKLDRLTAAYRRQVASAPAAASGADGAFAMRGLAPGEYRLVVSHASHLPHWQTLATVPAQGPARVEIVLAPALEIRGRVVDELGQAVPGAAVEASPLGAMALKGRTRREKQLLDWEEGRALVDEPRAACAADGTFVLGPLAPEPQALRASHPEYLPGDAVDAAAGEAGVVLALRRGSTLRGRIVDAEAKPTAGAVVRARPARPREVHRIFDWSESDSDPADAGSREARAARDGSFQLHGLELRAYTLEVIAAARAPLEREIEVDAADVDLGDIQLTAPFSIAGVVLGPEGKPLARARVWAASPENSVRASDSLGTEVPDGVAAAESDGDGRFTLAGLPAGSLDVGADADGCAGVIERGVASGSSGVRLLLQRGLTIHGKVVDASDEAAVSGATVLMGFGRRKRATSGPDGSFVITGFPLEEVYGSSTWVRTSHPEAGMQSDANVTVLGRTAASPLVIRLGASTQTLRGSVVDAAGKPLAGAQVWIETSDAEAAGFTPPIDRRTMTAADGTFALREPDWLRHSTESFRIGVVASHPGHAAARSGPLETPPSGEPWPLVSLALTPGAALEGTVTGADGQPLERARLTVWRASGAPAAAARGLGALLTARHAFAGKDGTYRIADLEPGAVEVEVEAAGHARARVQGIVLAEGEPAHRDVQLARGASIRGRVTDTNGAALPGVEVTAVLEGEPVAARIDIPEFTRRMEERARSGLALAWSRQDGSFELGGLPAGSFTVLARAIGYDTARATGVQAGDAGIQIALARFSALRGGVVDHASGRPITTFRVNVIDKARRNAEKQHNDWRIGSQGELFYQDALGRFLYDGLRPGAYEVVIQSPGFLAARLDAEIAAGEERSIEARLWRGARIEGVAIDAETGSPVSGAMVDCFRQLSREEHDAQMARDGFVRAVMAPPSGLGSYATGADGRFVLDGLLPGEYTLNVVHPFYRGDAAGSRRIELGASGAQRADLALQAAGRIEGTIRGLRRDVASGQRVHHGLLLERIDDASAAAGRGPDLYVDAAGRFHASGVSPGRYRVILTRQAFKPGKFIELSPGAGSQTLEPVGAQQNTLLGEVEVRAREVTTLAARVE